MRRRSLGDGPLPRPALASPKNFDDYRVNSIMPPAHPDDTSCLEVRSRPQEAEHIIGPLLRTRAL